jgi:hypothetical protein
VADQLLPPPELAPPRPDRLTREQRIKLWADLTDTCEEFLLVGLRRKIGPHGDLKAAYREWYERQMEEHDRTTMRTLQELARRSAKNAR